MLNGVSWVCGTPVKVAGITFEVDTGKAFNALITQLRAARDSITSPTVEYEVRRSLYLCVCPVRSHI